MANLKTLWPYLVLMGLFFLAANDVYGSVPICPYPERDYFILINDCKDAQYIVISNGSARYIRDSELEGHPEKAKLLNAIYDYNRKINRLVEFQLDCS